MGRAVFYRARYLDAQTGRFLSEDPLRLEAGDQNLYRYVGNSPLNFRDPGGQFVFVLPLVVPAGGVILEGAIVAAKITAVAILASQLARDSQDSSQQDESTADLPGSGESCPADPSDLTDKIGKIADETGMQPKDIRKRIHEAKKNIPRSGPTNNPDVLVDTQTGEIFPQTPSGGPGDSIGNLFD